jgi:hypothetical protein
MLMTKACAGCELYESENGVMMYHNITAASLTLAAALHGRGHYIMAFTNCMRRPGGRLRNNPVSDPSTGHDGQQRLFV